MRCYLVRAQLQDLLEDRLTPTEKSGIEAHLADCPACSLELESWQEFWSELDGLAPSWETPDLEQAVLSGIEQDPNLPRGLVALFALACAGTLAGFCSWADGLAIHKDIISACLWAAAGIAGVFTVWRAVLRKADDHVDEAMQEVMEDCAR